MLPEKDLQHLLDERNSKGLLRKLRVIPDHIIDFSSNDYLGFSRPGILKETMKNLERNFSDHSYGSGGSRLLAGNSSFAEELEKEIADFFHSESALIFNSGYDANLGFFSCVPQKNDIVFYDELVHASIHDGMRLSHAKCFKFRHNDLDDLQKKTDIQKTENGNVFIAVESVYSMDGDCAPLKELSSWCEKNNFLLVVDEAHAGGVFGKEGRGLCEELEIEEKCFARLYTFSKALGAHGAAICGSTVLRNYLINFSRPFIFSTSLPFDSLLAIKAGLHLLRTTKKQEELFRNIKFFQNKFLEFPGYKTSSTSVQSVIIPGNEKIQKISELLFEKGFDVRAVKSPTVKAGEERLRVSLHSFNNTDEINRLFVELSGIKDLSV